MTEPTPPPLGPEAIPADLELLDVETAALVRTAEALSDADLDEPSGCAGWTRGHVLAHVARNAESLVRLCLWARTGVVTPQYPSREARDADIEAGASRPAAVSVEDVSVTAALVRDALAALVLPLAAHQVGDPPFDARTLPRRRLAEVVFHHDDLRAGWTLADATPLAAADLLAAAVDRFAAKPDCPGLRLQATEGETYVVGDGAHEVTGASADLLGWLARGRRDGVRAPGGLPDLPPWG